ncbi:MAG TPA: FkbM family methyltransferase [Mycobacteriales bacterium]|nr:FkbM family methyltransferase [Mycobacteriales bacterium]
MITVRTRLLRAIDRAGFELRRHPAHRRVQLLHAHGVDLVLDVGAARGGYASELRRFGYGGRLVSFEPLGQAHEALAARAAGDLRWTVHHTALGDRPGTAQINVAGNSDSSSLLPMLDRHRSAHPPADYVGTEQVAVSTLDAFAAELDGARAPFLKVDTQGFERAVLDGARTVLPALVGVQLELSFVPLYQDGMLVQEAIDRMVGAGFVLMRVEPGFTDASNGQMLQADGLFFRP